MADLSKETESKLIPAKQPIDYSTATKKPLILAAAAAALGAYNLGTCFGWSSSVQPQLQRWSNASTSTLDYIGGNESENSNTTTTTWQLELTSDEMSWASSLVNIGALFGALCAGFPMEKFGRRVVLMAMVAPYTIGWLLVTLAVYPGMLYGGRVICGLAAGICSAAVPCYVGEISTPDMRGVVGMFFTTGLSLGVFIASLLVWLDWRLISAILTVQPLLLLLGMYFVPESPYFLVKRGRVTDAEKALKWLRGSVYNTEAELGQIKDRVRIDSTQSAKFSDIFQPWAYKPILIGIAMMIFMQFSGLNAALFYSVEIFRISASDLDPAICSVIVKAVQVIMNVLASLLLVQRFGRKTLHAATEALATIGLFALGAYFYILETDPEKAESLSWMPVTFFIWFICSLALGVVPLAWVVANEVLPARLRSIGSSIAAFTTWSSAFIVTKTFVDIQRSLSTAGVFWIYGGFCFLGLIFSTFILPETKGKTFDEIQSYFIPKKDRHHQTTKV